MSVSGMGKMDFSHFYEFRGKMFSLILRGNRIIILEYGDRKIMNRKKATSNALCSGFLVIKTNFCCENLFGLSEHICDDVLCDFLFDFMFLALGITDNKHSGLGFSRNKCFSHPSSFLTWRHLRGLDETSSLFQCQCQQKFSRSSSLCAFLHLPYILPFFPSTLFDYDLRNS